MHHNFLFDLDQTLLDFHASEYKALGIVLRANGLSFSDEIYRAFKAYNKSLWLELEKGTISRTELFTKRFLDVFSRCEGDASGLDPLQINDDFIRTMSVNGVLMDGALEFVRRVKENIPDARIWIASNGATVNAKGRIASTGLDRYIDGLFISEDMGVTKPDAAFFDFCLDRIGEPGSSCIMIGDSLSSDMLGAKNASLDSVWFMPSGNIEEAIAAYDINYCASSYDELYDILEKWSSGKRAETDGGIKMEKGRILYLNGVTSSGKTSIVEALQARRDVFFYVVANDLFQEMIGEEYLQENYWKYLGEVIILMYHTAKLFSDMGKNVIIDSILVERDGVAPHYERMKEILRDNPLDIVEVFCPPEICRQRNIDRGDRYETQSEEQAALMAKDIRYSFRVDTGKLSPEECADAILKALFTPCG